jgi:hypothetical protein
MFVWLFLWSGCFFLLSRPLGFAPRQRTGRSVLTGSLHIGASAEGKSFIIFVNTRPPLQKRRRAVSVCSTFSCAEILFNKIFTYCSSVDINEIAVFVSQSNRDNANDF